AGAVDDRAVHPSGDLAVLDLQRVGGGVVDAEVLDEGVGDLGEAAADDGELVVEALEGPDHRAGPGGQLELAADLVYGGRVEPGEQRDPLAQGALEVELAAHGGLGDLGDLVEAAGVLGEQLDDLALDEGGVDVHDDEPLGAPVQAALLDGDVDLLLGGLGGQRGAERVGVGAGDVHLDAGDGILREPLDAVDVGAVRGDAARDARHRGRL